MDFCNWLSREIIFEYPFKIIGVTVLVLSAKTIFEKVIFLVKKLNLRLP